MKRLKTAAASVAASTSPRDLSTVRCFRCGEVGHYAQNCAQSAGASASSRGGPPRCYRCQLLGHIVRECPQPEGASSGGGRARTRRPRRDGASEEQAPEGGWQYGHRRADGEDGEDGEGQDGAAGSGDKSNRQKEGKKKETAEERAERLARREKPSYKASGKLAAETNTSAGGVQLKWSEPPEARKPTNRWRLYVFKEGEHLEPLQLHRQSAYLFGKDTLVSDVPTRHPTCSRQHAVLQFREVLADKQAAERDPSSREATRRVVRPYLMDLRSVNGTFLNGERIKPARYYELREQDLVKFGLSTREYVLLNADEVHAIETKKM
jgi:smad nuclear-interacting protein 1